MVLNISGTIQTTELPGPPAGLPRYRISPPGGDAVLDVMGVGDAEEGLGLAVDVTEAASQGAFDEVDAVLGLLEAEGLVGWGAQA